MYITITWTAQNPADVDDVEAEIVSALDALPFTNFFSPFDGSILANIESGYYRDEVDRLQTVLRATADGRFTFVITASPYPYAMWRSLDVPKPTLDAISNYK